MTYARQYDSGTTRKRKTARAKPLGFGPPTRYVDFGESFRLPGPTLGSSSGGQAREGLSTGIMPCRGVPQAAQASAFKVISAPQHVQYAAKIASNVLALDAPRERKIPFRAKRRVLFRTSLRARVSALLREVLSVRVVSQAGAAGQIAHFESLGAVHGAAEDHEILSIAPLR